MRKYLVWPLILWLGIAVTGCSSEQTEQSVKQSSAPIEKPAETTAPPAPAPVPEPKPIFDVYSIIDKNLYGVEQVLGEHETEKEGNWRYGPEEGNTLPYVFCTFAKGKYEVMFHEAKAVRIRINLPDKKFKYPEDAEIAMRAVGLKGIYDLSTVPAGVFAGKVSDFYNAEAGRWADYKEPYIQFVKVVVDENFK